MNYFTLSGKRVLLAGRERGGERKNAGRGDSPWLSAPHQGAPPHRRTNGPTVARSTCADLTASTQVDARRRSAREM